MVYDDLKFCEIIIKLEFLKNKLFQPQITKIELEVNIEKRSENDIVFTTKILKLQ